jgi:opacity protein-like surface antigen
MRHPIAIALALFLAGPSSAQDQTWDYKATLYGWLPGMTTAVDTRFGTIESSSSGSDVLEDLDFVFMGTFAAQNGRWGIATDLLYVSLSDTKDTPLALYGEGTVAVKATAFSTYALYRLTTDPSLNFDIGPGFRAFDLEVDVSLSPGLAAAETETVGDTWIDPLIAARLEVPLDESWFLNGFADFGGTGGGDRTWQVFGSVGYAFSEAWSAQAGYRYMDISKRIDGRDVSIDLGGPIIGMTYRF